MENLTTTERMALAELASNALWTHDPAEVPELDAALRTALPKLRGQAATPEATADVKRR
jgi:hypothetical protein